MSLFSSKRYRIISLINNDNLYFIDWMNQEKILLDIPVDKFLDMDLKEIANNFKIDAGVMNNTLLVLPDYWIGNEYFTFKSKKSLIIESFIERKLQGKFPNNDMKYFYNYVFMEELQKLYVIYLQESKAINLYNKLNMMGLGTHKIISPAILWQSILSKKISEFGKGGKGFIHLLPSECFMYFFSGGNFVFSRNVFIPESSEEIDTLVYEINQSLYLFSQEVKEEVEKIYLLYGRWDFPGNIIKNLSDMTAREIIDLREFLRDLPENPKNEHLLGPLAYLSLSEISHPQSFLFITHRMEAKALEWKPVFKTGIVIGLILLLLIVAEYIFLYKKSHELKSAPLKSQLISKENILKRLDNYDNALNLILEDVKRPSVVPLILKLIESLPDNITIKELLIDVEKEPHMDIQCVIMASGPDEFKSSLSALLSNLKRYFPGANNLGMDNIRLEETRKEKGIEYYTIKFKLFLL